MLFYSKEIIRSFHCLSLKEEAIKNLLFHSVSVYKDLSLRYNSEKERNTKNLLFYIIMIQKQTKNN